MDSSVHEQDSAPSRAHNKGRSWIAIPHQGERAFTVPREIGPLILVGDPDPETPKTLNPASCWPLEGHQRARAHRFHAQRLEWLVTGCEATE